MFMNTRRDEDVVVLPWLVWQDCDDVRGKVV